MKSLNINEINFKALYNTIFNNITETDTTLFFGSQDEKAINTHVYTYLKDNWKLFYKSYNDKINKFISDLETKTAKKTRRKSKRCNSKFICIWKSKINRYFN
ncbi:hypothetical protein [Spiroplasma taiwanense]|uniref:hypothetical protein n=1 Tax=Spiroplasma taiwanense TaxID=2145 RepID=UPI00040E51F5|nr:hypothetical protein [Spiroplasma taiwanense]